jgi:hypothetical protein
MVSVIKNKVKTRFEKLLESIVNFFLKGTRGWGKTIAGFTVSYKAAGSQGRPGVLVLRRGSNIIFHSDPQGPIGCPICDSGTQAEHDHITAQLIKFYSKQ